MGEKQMEVANKLREMLVENLRLNVEPDEIEYGLTLFNEGLGLDSVDGLELIAAIDNEYGISLTGEQKQHFKNITTLSRYIVERLEESA